MNGLAEIALLIEEVEDIPPHQSAWLTPARLAAWLHEHKVLNKLFGMTKAEFNALPQWKQNNHKKKVKLY